VGMFFSFGLAFINHDDLNHPPHLLGRDSR